MNLRYLFYTITLFFSIGCYNQSTAQIIKDPVVTITDQNNLTKPIINCDYKFHDLDKHSLLLTVDYPDIKITDSYSVKSIDYEPLGNFTEGTEIPIRKIDDIWSNLIPLPFNFCLYGKTFNSLIVSDNGAISFDIPEKANGEAAYKLPVAENPGNSVISEGNKLSPYTIFGAFHDLILDPEYFECITSGGCGKITMFTTGTAPYRKFVINYIGVNHYNGTNSSNCTNIKSTFQVVLYESTNIIDVYIKQKPPTCGEGKAERFRDIALIGITDKIGKGISPPGRSDIDKWSTDENGSEAWRFSPEGDNEPIIKWYDSELKEIGTNKSIEVSPTINTTYHVEVIYNTCGLGTLTSSIPIIIDYEFPIAKEIKKEYCYEKGATPITKDFTELAEDATEGNLSKFNYYFYESKEKALNNNNIDRKPGVTIMNTESKTMYLRVENKNNNACFSIVPLTIILRSTPNADLIANKYNYCAEENKDVILTNIIRNGILTLPDSEWRALYFLTAKDAENYTEGGSIKPINDLKLPPPPSRLDLYARVYNLFSPNCYINIPVIIETTPTVKIPPIGYVKCSPFSFDDNLTNYIEQIPNNENYTFTFHTNYDDAFKNVNPIPEGDRIMYPNGTTTSYPVKNGLSIYIRADNKKEGYCPIITSIDYVLSSTRLKDQKITYCDTYGTGIEIDLENIFKSMNPDPNSISISDITYYDNLGQILGDKIKKYPVTNSTNITFKYTENGCNFSETLLTIFINKRIPKEELFKICDSNDDGEENFDLRKLIPTLSEGYTPNYIYFYRTLEALNRDHWTDRINNITVKKGEDNYVYARMFVYLSQCTFVYKVKLELTDQMFAETNNFTAKICDNNLDNKEIINLTTYNESLINTTDLENYSFKYFLSYNDALNEQNPILKPEKYMVENLSEAIIYVRINDNNSFCSSIVELNFEDINSIKAHDLPKYYCDEGEGYQGGINLVNMAQEEMGAASNVLNITISYHDTEENANNSSTTTMLKNPEKYFITSTTNAWIRFDDGECYTVRKIMLIMEAIPKLKKPTYYICDDNFDGIYLLNNDDLKKINSELIESDTETYTFTYYSDSDGINQIDPLTYPMSSLPNKKMDFYVKASRNGCESTELGVITINTNEVVRINPVIPEIKNCDDNFDGITTFNLNSVVKELHDPAFPLPKNPEYSIYSTYSDAKEERNPKDINSYTNVIPNEDIVFVRINSTSNCPSIGEIKLKVQSPPTSSLLHEYMICANGSVIIDANSGEKGDYYEWNTGEKGYDMSSITVDKAGTYSVTITNANNCKYTYSTKVTEYPKIAITDIITGDDYILINADGAKPLEFSKDNINWQDGNVFSNLEPGIYTFYIRSKDIPCDPVTGQGIIFGTHVNNLITPNNDGYNDVWTMCNLDLFNGEKSSIKIFDRYGKVVFEENSNTCFIWDGHYLGRTLPTTSYWYIINFPDGRELTGWIMLKNYNDSLMN